MLKIEKNIPIPKRGRHSGKYSFVESMAEGDSVVATHNEATFIRKKLSEKYTNPVIVRRKLDANKYRTWLVSKENKVEGAQKELFIR